MSLPRTSKEKSARIDWGYHAAKRPMVRVRTWLWVLAFALVAVPLVGATVGYALTDTGHTTFTASASRGPLTNAHAAWDTQCEACHVPFQPVSGDAKSARLLATFGIGPGHPKDASASVRCEQCHAGPPHNPAAKAESTVGCATCHRDHQGRDFSLVNLADSNCTSCHANLGPHHLNPAGMTVAANISSFTGDHPDFRPVTAKHKRAMKFSHAVHMAPGMGLGGKSAYSLSKMDDPADRAKYAAMLKVADPNAAIQLDCASCHKPDAKGAYYEPIIFEANCKACHPLTFDESPGLRTRSVPHHSQPDALDRYLREVYSARYLESQLQGAAGVDRGTGRVDPRVEDLDPKAKAAAMTQIETEVAKAKRDLFAGKKACLECHHAEFPAPGPGVDPRIPTKIIPATSPAMWLTKGKFDHAAHRAVQCNQCHQGAYRTLDDERKAARQYAGSGTFAEPEYQHPPDVPGIANCRQCHSPARVENGVSLGGVRSACTDCHAYHHGSQTPKNPPGSVADFLRGRPGK